MSILHKLRLIVLTIAFTLLGVNMLLGAFSSLKNIHRLEDLKNEVRGMEMRRDGLKEEIAYKSTDDYIEEKARNDLNLAKPGEKVYIVSGLEPEKTFSPEQKEFKELAKTSQNVAGAHDSAIQMPVWYDWYSLFFK
jgi:cell division protein FtsB